MKHIRNIAHYIVGFVFLYCIANATYVVDFPTWQKIVGSIFIGLIFGGTIGIFWEFFNLIAFKIQGDINDVKRTAIGGFFGCLLASFYPDIQFISVCLFWLCIGLILIDIVRAIIKWT